VPDILSLIDIIKIIKSTRNFYNTADLPILQLTS